LALAAVGLALAGPTFSAQAQPGAPAKPAQAPVKTPEPFASIKKVEPFTYCSVAHKGPLTDMRAVIGQFMQAQGLFAGVRGVMIGVYNNSPGEVKPEELRTEIWIPVEK